MYIIICYYFTSRAEKFLRSFRQSFWLHGLPTGANHDQVTQTSSRHPDPPRQFWQAWLRQGRPLLPAPEIPEHRAIQRRKGKAAGETTTQLVVANRDPSHKFCGEGSNLFSASHKMRRGFLFFLHWLIKRQHIHLHRLAGDSRHILVDFVELLVAGVVVVDGR